MSDERTDLLKAALDYAARGWRVLPLHTPAGTGGCSCGDPECGSLGKHPRTAHGLKDATTDPATIGAWWQQWPAANIGVLTGTPSGFFVLDIDGDEAVRTLKEFDRIPPKEHALWQRTGRGWQVLFEVPADFAVKNTAGAVAEHVDTRGDGGYIVAPPSLHANGKRYQWLTTNAPGPAPAWLLEALRPVERSQAKPAGANVSRVSTRTGCDGVHPYLAAALEDEATKVRAADDGTRNATLNHAAFSLGQLEAAGLCEADAQAALAAAATAAGLTATEAARTFASGWDAGRQQPRDIPEPTRRTDCERQATAGPDPRPRGAGRSTADRLVELGRQRYAFGQSLEGEPFAVAKDGLRIARMLRGQSGSLRSDLAAAYLEAHGKTPTQSALADAVCALEGLALNEPRHPLYVRFAAADGVLWVDLGDATGRAVMVTAEGWQVDTAPQVLFRRSALTGALPEPVPGDLRDWRRFLNVTDEAWALLAGCLVSTFYPDIPHPILALTGEQGSAKTTTARQYVDLCDPSAAPLRTAPRDIGEWVTVAAGSAVIGLDNVSSIPSWLSDALCRAVTGEGFASRQLYTDGDIVVKAFRRCIMLNGIELGALSADLVDRAAFVELQRIPADRRRLDSELQRDFAALRPALFGGVLDLVAATLRHLPSVRLASYPRMADHAKVLAALDMVADLGALPAFLAVSGRAFQEAVEGDPVAAAVARFMADRTKWSGELAELLDLLTNELLRPERPPKLWPPDVARLSARMRRAAPALRAVGFGVELDQDEGTRHRTVTITRERAAKTACLPCEPCSAQAMQAKQVEIPARSRDVRDAVPGDLLSSLESQAAFHGPPAAIGETTDEDGSAPVPLVVEL